MDDKDIEKMITSAADHLPIPWVDIAEDTAIHAERKGNGNRE